jgi:glycosyltransferase involved in cell wall biosynthesis
MGLAHRSLDPGLIACLRRELAADRFIETGTYEGDSVLVAQPFFSEIHTIESHPEIFEGARTRFQDTPGIEVHLGNSPEVLAQLENAEPTVYWLDAHWCEGLLPTPPLCPLLEELAAIGSLDSDSAILIGDARLFLSPPPAPHPIEGWPSLGEVLAALRRLSETHEPIVIEDALVFAPPSGFPALRLFAHEHGRDIVRRGEEIAVSAGGPDPSVAVALHDQLEDVQRSVASLSAQVETLQHSGLNGDGGGPRWSRAPLAAWKYRVNRLNRLEQHPPRSMRIPARYKSQRPPANPPSISIVTPSFNQGAYIAETARSVLEQNYPALEYVIQDGGSQDQTLTAVDSVRDQLHRLTSAPDRGQSHAINLGFADTSGELMAYLNSDDLLLPGSLAYVASWFRRNPDTDVVYGHRVIIDQFGDEIGRWVMPPHDDEILSWADFVPQETLFWRRSAWLAAGGRIDETFDSAMDWDLLLRLRDSGAKFERVPRFLGAFRVHDNQKTSMMVRSHGLPEMQRIRNRLHGRHVSQREVVKRIRPYLLRHVWHDQLYRRRLVRY